MQPRSPTVLATLFFLLLPLGAALGSVGPGSSTGPRAALPTVDPGRLQQADSSLLILAAASLTDVLPRVAAQWVRSGGTPVRFSFDATSRLAPQTLQGAGADLFFSADQRWMDWVEERGGIVGDTRVDLLGNELVVVVPVGGNSTPREPADLLSGWVRHVALAGENVPAGRYARNALESAGIWGALESRAVSAGNVRGALEWVARGEADVGIVYRTDAVAENRVRVAFAFPPASHPPITYPAAVLEASGNRSAATEFLEFCRSEAAQAVFGSAGFVPLADRSASGLSSLESGAQTERPPDAPLPDPWAAVRLSFLVALAATLIGFVPAVGVGWLLARKDFPGKSAVATLFLVPLVLPPVVTGFLLLTLLGTQAPVGGWLADLGFPVPFTLLGATLAALTVGMPLYVVSVRNAFEVVDPRYEEVSWTLGRRPWPTFLRITFPLALPGIAAGAVLAFARALGEFGATVVLAGNVEGSTRTIALAVYTLLESPQGRETIWILVGSSVCLSLGALLGYEMLSRRQRRRMEGHRGR